MTTTLPLSRAPRPSTPRSVAVDAVLAVLAVTGGVATWLLTVPGAGAPGVLAFCAVLAGLIVLAAWRVRRDTRGAAGQVALTGRLTGHHDTDLRAVRSAERQASTALGALVVACVQTVGPFLLALSGPQPLWPAAIGTSGCLILGARLNRTRPGARAKALRARFHQGFAAS